MERALATAVHVLEGSGREDLAEGLVALWQAAETLAKRTLVMHVDAGTVSMVGLEIVEALEQAYESLEIDDVSSYELVEWVDALVRAVAEFPPTVRGEKAAATARERLREILATAGSRDDEPLFTIRAPLESLTSLLAGVL